MGALGHVECIDAFQKLGLRCAFDSLGGAQFQVDAQVDDALLRADLSIDPATTDALRPNRSSTKPFLPALSYSVFKNAISAFFSSPDKSNPKSCPGSASVFTPGPFQPDG